MIADKQPSMRKPAKKRPAGSSKVIAQMQERIKPARKTAPMAKKSLASKPSIAGNSTLKSTARRSTSSKPLMGVPRPIGDPAGIVKTPPKRGKAIAIPGIKLMPYRPGSSDMPMNEKIKPMPGRRVPKGRLQKPMPAVKRIPMYYRSGS